MAETLSLDGIKTKLEDTVALDSGTLAELRGQLAGPVMESLGHSPVRRETIVTLLNRISFELAARAVESAMEIEAPPHDVLGSQIKAKLGGFVGADGAQFGELETVS